MGFIREPAVAGRFYPGTPGELGRDIRACFAKAKPSEGPVPKALIAPHAGYVYSGAVAASAYLRLTPAKDVIKRVILLGPCHRVAVQGLALSGAEAFRTPLGDIPIDDDLRQKALALPGVQVFDDTHAQEHSLEVHLPFLQAILGDFTLLPVVVGACRPDLVAGFLEALWGGPETLIVVSSDLSHYHTYDEAQALDGFTAKAIQALDGGPITGTHACGHFPVSGLLALAKAKGLRVNPVDIRNSGDTAGPKDKVVGYGSWVFTDSEGAAMTETQDSNGFEAKTRALIQRHGPLLLRIAAASLDCGLRTGEAAKVNVDTFPPELRAEGASFVTLKKQGRLRGCIGSPQAYRPLIMDVVENGFRAGFSDPRFPKLTAEEKDQLDLSISILSPSAPMTFSDEAGLLDQLRPEIDGLIIEDGGRRALFLPSVWEQLPDKLTFLSHLRQKAGLKPDHWSPGFKARRFIAAEIKAKDLDDPVAVWPQPKKNPT